MPKMPGLTPNTRPQGSRGIMYIDYGARAGPTARKWPRKRPGPLPVTTEAQTAAWDLTMQMIKSAIPQQWQEAHELAAGTGFYVRDVLTSGCYAHVISWPGWGVYANGAAAPPLHVTKRLTPSFPPLAPGVPQAVNIITDWKVNNAGDPITIDAKTYLDASPTLLAFCCEPIKITVTVKRRGIVNPHGYKLFYPCDPVEYTPTTGLGTTHHWNLPAGDFAPPCPNCALVVVQKNAQPRLDWESLRMDCPVGHPTPPPASGYYWRSVGGIGGPHGFVPNPAQVAAFNAQLDSVKLQYHPQHIAVEVRDFLYSDSIWIPQVAGMTPANVPVDIPPSQVGGFYSVTIVDPLTPNVSTPGGDFYNWGLLLHYT